jgi:hypothetical protein
MHAKKERKYRECMKTPRGLLIVAGKSALAGYAADFITTIAEFIEIFKNFLRR